MSKNIFQRHFIAAQKYMRERNTVQGNNIAAAVF